LDVFVKFIGGGFVENDGVLGLVLDCSSLGFALLRTALSTYPSPWTTVKGVSISSELLGPKMCRSQCSSLMDSDNGTERENLPSSSVSWRRSQLGL
jgi:hypothetical protein